MPNYQLDKGTSGNDLPKRGLPAEPLRTTLAYSTASQVSTSHPATNQARLPKNLCSGMSVAAKLRDPEGQIRAMTAPAFVAGIEWRGAAQGVWLLRYSKPEYAGSQAHDFLLNDKVAGHVPGLRLPLVLQTARLEYMPFIEPSTGQPNDLRCLGIVSRQLLQEIFTQLQDNDCRGQLSLVNAEDRPAQSYVVPALGAGPTQSIDLPGVKTIFWPALNGVFKELRQNGLPKMSTSLQDGLQKAMQDSEAGLRNEDAVAAQLPLDEFVSRHPASTMAWTAIARLHERFALAGHVSLQRQAREFAVTEYETALALQPGNDLARDGLARLMRAPP